jgi:hypothetical protein
MVCAMTEPLHRTTPDLSTGLAESDTNELLHPWPVLLEASLLELLPAV